MLKKSPANEVTISTGAKVGAVAGTSQNLGSGESD
jgi:hypothetical protein